MKEDSTQTESIFQTTSLNRRAEASDAVREVEQALLRLQSAQDRAGDAATAEQGYRRWLTATQARYSVVCDPYLGVDLP